MKQHLLSVLVVCIAMVAGCRSNANDPVTAPTKTVPAQSFARSWSTQLGVDAKDPVSEIHLREDTVFLYTKGHVVYGVNRTSGQLLYYNPVTAASIQLWPPIVLTDSVVFPTNDSLELYNHRGRKLRTVDLDYSLRGPGIGSGKRIYVGNNAGTGNRVAAIDVEREYANTRWQLMTFGAVSAAPALHKGVLFIGSEDGRIYAVTETREPHWPLEGGVFLTYGSIRADIKADDFGVYIASTDSKLYCVDRSNAKVKWQYFAGAELKQSPIITAKTVYQAIPGKGVAAINKTEGKYNREPDWVISDGLQFLSEDNKYAYIRRNDNVIVAIDRATGEVAFKSKRADFDLFASNDKGDGVIYAATSGGQVMAIQPVLKPGSVGELVLRPVRMESIALAN